MNERNAQAGRLLSASENQESHEYKDGKAVPGHVEDFAEPNPIHARAIPKEISGHCSNSRAYSAEKVAAMKDTNLRGEDLWLEFTCTFRSSNIGYMAPAQHLELELYTQQRCICHAKRGLCEGNGTEGMPYIRDVHQYFL